MSDHEETVNISLIIDDDNVTHLDININNLKELDKKCSEVIHKYQLDPLLKNKLKKKIQRDILQIKEQRFKTQMENKNRIDDNVNRLYYESIEKEKEKEKYIQKINEEKEKLNFEAFTFTPYISKKSNELYKRNHAKIEDKLYYDHFKTKEKLNYQRLIDKVKQEKTENKQHAVRAVNVIAIENNLKNVTVDSSDIKEEEKDDKISLQNEHFMGTRTSLRMNSIGNNVYKRSYTEKYKNQLGTSVNSSHLQTPTKNNFERFISKPASMKNLITVGALSFEVLGGGGGSRYDVRKNTAEKKSSLLKIEKIIEVPESSIKKKNKSPKPKSPIMKPNYDKVPSRLYMDKQKLKELNKRKEEMANRQLKLHCPFSPKIGQRSKQIISSSRVEDKEEFINRLTYSKKIANITKNISYASSNFKEYKSITTRANSANKLKTTQGNIGMTSQSGRLLTTSNDTRRKRNQSQENPSYEVKSIRETKQQDQIFNEINEIRLNDETKKQLFEESYHLGMRNYKLNYLKDIYETIETNVSSIEDIAKLDMLEVPIHIKEQVIIPTCTILNERDLEFNFYNFYHIADEILNHFFNLN
jgi:hypothetical protein